MGIEPTTSSLPRTCSTTELRQHSASDRLKCDSQRAETFRHAPTSAKLLWRESDTLRGLITSGRRGLIPSKNLGAGGGNRTRDSCLEGKGITIMQRPRCRQVSAQSARDLSEYPQNQHRSLGEPRHQRRYLRIAGLLTEKEHALHLSRERVIGTWWAGLDSNQRTALRGPDLQSGAFNHSTTYPWGRPHLIRV